MRRNTDANCACRSDLWFSKAFNCLDASEIETGQKAAILIKFLGNLFFASSSKTYAIITCTRWYHRLGPKSFSAVSYLLPYLVCMGIIYKHYHAPYPPPTTTQRTSNSAPSSWLLFDLQHSHPQPHPSFRIILY